MFLGPEGRTAENHRVEGRIETYKTATSIPVRMLQHYAIQVGVYDIQFTPLFLYLFFYICFYTFYCCLFTGPYEDTLGNARPSLSQQRPV